MVRPGGRPVAVYDAVWPAGTDAGGTVSSTGFPAAVCWLAGGVTLRAPPTSQVTPIDPSTWPSAAAVIVLAWAASVIVGVPATTPPGVTASPAGSPAAV